VIVLASGENIDPEAIEAHYRKSPFVKEVCVTGRLHAVVVPDMDLMRRRKIVNIGDLLRFELEGLTHDLPAHQRVLGYHISFDPLPRADSGINRPEVERRLAAATLAAMREQDLEWLREPHAAAAVPLIQARAKTDRIWPDANLEIDLGLDSMERVELLLELKKRSQPPFRRRKQPKS
jgi:long-chain acyl-CoA synthetase